MASITINPVSVQIPTIITGEEKLVTIGANGKPITVSINQILNKVDDSIADRVENQVLTSIDNQIEERVEQVIENTATINKEDIDNLFTT